MADDPAQPSEQERLSAVIASYGEAYSPFDAKMRDYMMRAFEPFFREGPCLQVGCAHGDQTSLLLDRFEDVTVVEGAPEFIEIARARVGGRARFVQGLVEDFETDERYETILFAHVLEHVVDPVVALRKLRDLLTPAGRLFLVVPNAEAASRRIAVKMSALTHLEALSPDDVAAGHRRVYRLDTLCRDTREAGLNIAHSGGIFFKPLANFQFNQLIGGPLISEAFMEGCYQLGLEHASFCASIYVVAERG
ncbi:class I SAM-dependent methyltransferase [Phenylobacterium sp.]|jgi:2-polyprenyl-3-methyl-5-hydroxy-6-metoxy-1,4-benzoquinol methylase|uniref:class I SAM-dependent methyltransferase n=1 Tax=Phenylobacterium sp. TaxID=1871053 RepID=UPI002E2FC1F3|nr:class I SAM-dependent methyltransferase [Phenylobacterium sp.]HEX4709592.1 class I SAM-dependent methyltransferase [Phenylobacterium sp.]